MNPTYKISIYKQRAEGGKYSGIHYTMVAKPFSLLLLPHNEAIIFMEAKNGIKRST